MFFTLILSNMEMEIEIEIDVLKIKDLAEDLANENLYNWIMRGVNI